MTHPTHFTSPKARLRLSPENPVLGRLDGAWWPRSDDLETELATILPIADERLHGVERVCYRLPDWTEAHRTAWFGRHRVHLDGYNFQAAATVRLVGPEATLVLAVVPAHTDPDVAEWEMDAALDRNERRSADELSHAAGPAGRARVAERAAASQWETDGGWEPVASAG